MIAAEHDTRITALLKEAAEWHVLGRLLECPSPSWNDDLARLSREIPTEALKAAAAHARVEGSEGLYHSVFGPGGPAPPREVSYHRSVELGNLMSEIESHYDAFAYRPNVNEPPDHVAVETGFVAYLRLKEAFAFANGDDQAAEVARLAAMRFTSEHLAQFAGRLAELLGGSGVDYLAEASSLLAARVGPKPISKQLPVLQPDAFGDDDEGEFACEL